MSRDVRVLIVDDSVVMRKAIKMMLQADARIEVVGEAGNGREAVERVKLLRPDVVTLDIEMPVMDGLQALRQIMREHPLPVIMLSSLTTDGASATLEALAAGAVDFLPKYSTVAELRDLALGQQIIAKILALGSPGVMRGVISRARARYLAAREDRPALPSAIGGHGKNIRAVLIGASTGGPQALNQIIPGLPRDLSMPIIILQHMPAQFSAMMAQRLNEMSAVDVREVRDQEVIEAGHVYIAPGGRQLRFRRFRQLLRAELYDAGEATLFRPSITAGASAFAAELFGEGAGIMLSGMGHDGLDGFMKMKAAGHILIAQSASTCVVNGMPKTIVDAGLADAVLTPPQILSALLEFHRLRKAHLDGAPAADLLARVSSN